MVILWRLMFGHFLADFTFQFDWVNRWKRSSVWGMIVHCAMHPATYAILTWPYLNEYWISSPLMRFKGWACLLIIFVAHFIEDQWRVFTIHRYRAPDNTLYFLWDQFIHYAVIALLMLSAAGAEFEARGLFPEKWPVLGCLSILVTNAGTVLIYFVEKDVFGGEFPEFREKYAGMAERLLIFGFMLMPGAWAAVPVALTVFGMHYVRHKKLIRLSWFNFYMSGAIGLLCGFAGRYVLTY